MKNKETLKFISRNIKGCQIKIAILSITQILLGAFTVAFSFMLRYVIQAMEIKDQDLLIKYTIILGCIAVLLIGLQIFYRLYYEVSYVDIENKLKKNLFNTILHKDYQDIKKIHDEEWIHRLTSDTNVIANAILSILPSLCRMVVQLVLALAAVIYLFPTFGLSLLPFIFLIILLTYFMRKRLKKAHHLVQEKDGRVKVFFFESLQGLSIIHSFVKEDVFAHKNEENLDAYKKARLQRNLFQIMCSIGFVVVYYAFYILAIIFCGNAIIQDVMSIGLLTAVVALLTQITGPLGNITSIIPRYYSLLASGERLKMEQEEILPCLSKEEINSFYQEEFKEINLKHISYSYLDKYDSRVAVLNDFSLNIHKNEKILIKGHSGSGKTTLMKIILTLLKPEKGEVLINDEPLDNRYAHLFAYVPQDNLLMEGTIKEIVTLYDDKFNQEQFDAALNLSSSSSFVNALVKKEETYLNEKGSGLSLGEMERIAIARALYSEAPIVLFDECSASLDLKTEQEVINHILSLKDKTIILISHHPYDETLFDQIIDLGD